MAETFPRWGFPDINFIEIDSEKIKTDIITGYEAVAKRSLAAGDPIRLFLLSIADRFIDALNNANIAGQQNLLTYAQAGNLDALGVLLSAERLDASPAMTTFQFTLTGALNTDLIIPQGFEVTNGIVIFATDKELVIPAGEVYGSMSATCTTAGVIGNDYLQGQITTIVKPMAYLQSATNTTVTSGGADAEGDEAYAERLRLATDSFSVAGPAAAYEFHARSVSPAIIDVSVFSPNPCEVEIYPLLTGGTIPAQELLDMVQEYFGKEDVIPMCDLVTVKAPEAYNYAINVDYYITRDDQKKATAIREKIEAAVQEYISWQQTEVGRPITPANLVYLVKQAGAYDVDLTTLSPPETAELTYGQVAQCTGVKINYKGAVL